MAKPKVKLEVSVLDRFIDAIGIGLILFLILMPIIYGPELPDQVPTHFNASGEADAYGDKSSLWTMPIVGFLTFALLFVMNFFPHTFNIPIKITEENAEVQYRLVTRMIRTLNLAIAGMFAYISWAGIQTALGNMNGLGQWFLPAVMIGSFLPIVIYFVVASSAK